MTSPDEKVVPVDIAAARELIAQQQDCPWVLPQALDEIEALRAERDFYQRAFKQLGKTTRDLRRAR